MNKKISKNESQALSYSFLFSHAVKETFRRKGYFTLSVLACFMVCLVALISKTVLNQGPIIFLMLAELSAGEFDLVFKNQPIPNYENDEVEQYRFYEAFMNYTLFTEKLKNSKENYFQSISEQSSPRMTFFAAAGKCQDCEDIMVDFQLIDSFKESQAEIGRSYPFQKMKKGECMLNADILQKMKFNINSSRTIYLTLNMDVLLRNLLISTYYDNTTHVYNENIEKIYNYSCIVRFPCSIVNVLDRNYGKSSEENLKFFIMEQEYFFDTISENLNSYLVSSFPDFPEVLRSQKISDFANTIYVNFQNPRLNSYLVSNIDELQFKGVSRANKIVELLGEENRNHYKVEMPVIDKMKPLFYGSIFLGLILNVIILILFILSLILIHSLLVITTETNTFELGLLRMLGTTKSGLVKIILIQCFCFSLPACILAYLLHFSILDGISQVLSKYTDNSTKLEQSLSSIIFAIILTNLAPLLASIMPIRNIFNKNLASTISNTSKASGVSIQIISAKETERQTLVTFGILTFLYGTSIYYFLPLSLLSINLNLLLLIFLWILIGMLFGFILLSLNVESVVQKFLTYIFFFWTQSSTRLIILKNLTAHRIRNRQTSLMYALSVGFFIMITVGLDIELKSLNLTRLLQKGAYVHLDNRGPFYMKPDDLVNSMQEMKSRKAIVDYTFISPGIDSSCFGAQSRIMNYGKSMDFKIDLFSVSPNFFNTAEKVFLKISESMESVPDEQLAEMMYKSENLGRIGLSGIFTWEIDLHLEDYFYLQISKDSLVLPFILKSSFILNSSPAFKMSAEPSTMYQRAALVPIHTYLDFVNKCWNYFINDAKDIKNFSFSDYPIDRVLLKVNPDIPLDSALKIIKEIVYTDPSYFVQAWYYWDSQKNFDKISSICNVIFYGVSFVVLLFCFFNLTASMTINIFEQKKEIAIYRSLGMTAGKVIFIYICESFILILASSIIGLVIGSIISWTMTLQRVIFTNLPLHFDFPYREMISILLVSVLSGIFSTLFPAKNLLSNQISNLTK